MPVLPRTHGLSLVIVSFNSDAALSVSLPTIRSYLGDAEIVIVENGEASSIPALADARVDQYLVGHGNIGFGSAVNLGAQAAAHETILVLNPDCVLTKADMDALTHLTRAQPLGLVGCHLSGTPDQSLPVRFPTVIEAIWTLGSALMVPRELDIRRPRVRHTSRFAWVPGAAFIVNRQEFLELGGFDECLFLYYEDFELSRRYAEARWPIRTTSAVTVTHFGSASSVTVGPHRTAMSLLSIIQMTGVRRGLGSAARVAHLIVFVLHAVAAIGRLLPAAAPVGRRAQRKAHEAGAILDEMAAFSSAAGTGKYDVAVDVLADILPR